MSATGVNPFNIGTHFYFQIYVRLDHFIDIRKGLWSNEAPLPQPYLQLSALYIQREEVEVGGVEGQQEGVEGEALNSGVDAAFTGLLTRTGYPAHGVTLSAGGGDENDLLCGVWGEMRR
ncbi:hypothetical protein E2C01_067069 [Portunus trituberculatus]|uniref:Uncharacterized protein n=1 Tax=Portunus trituberculatus TaxID=210409 RepID=A0A5B7HSM9_PORTR|nr:hypothetical protein [Portunus trituberculatus]